MSYNYILCYTRTPLENLIYSPKLAYSMHLAYSKDGKDFQALNHNSGVLFAKATENKDGTLNAKSLKNPYLFQLRDGSFGVIAIRTEATGEPDPESKGKVLLFTSSDLLDYEELGLLDLQTDQYIQDIACQYDASTELYIISWQDAQGEFYKTHLQDLGDLKGIAKPQVSTAFAIESPTCDVEGAVPRNLITVSDEIADRLVKKLTVPMNIGIEVPKTAAISSKEELVEIKATALYSDGTKAVKSVDWNTEGINWDQPGTYNITGEVVQPHFPFPLVINRADPCVTKWKGKYYFVSTNDADHNNTLYIREADTLTGLAQAEDVLILDTKTYPEIKGLLWAPELHIIDGELYLFHAATPGEFFWQQAQVMHLKTGGNPLNASDWSRPKRVLRQDGSYLCEAGKTISLDMTYFKIGDEHYVSWSQRQFVPVDQGAWLYIAKICPKKPWQLINEPVLLSRPEYGWANNNTFVDEGPFALITSDKVFLTYSSALVDATYVVALLSADLDSDLMDPANWRKGNYPLLTSRSVPGEFGAGHNAYVIDGQGTIWNTYHARPGVDGPRSTGIRRVHFDIDGEPRLDLTEERDLNQELANVSIEVVLGKDG